MSDTARRAECPIRRLAGVDDYIQCEELQRRVWHFRGDLDVIPRTQLVAAQKAGGIVLGAFDAGGQLVGFCYGFRGEDDRGRALHYSHMLAVDVFVSFHGARGASQMDPARGCVCSKDCISWPGRSIHCNR